MAVSDKSIEQLAKSVTDLVNSIKQKNSFGSSSSDGSSSVRMGRGGSSNASDASGDNLNASIKGLKDLHKSMKSGGMSIADHFTKLAKSINPINKAFDDLEDSIHDIVEQFGVNYKELAQAAADFVKANKGNVQKLKRESSAVEKYAQVVKKLVSLQEDGVKDVEVLRALLKEEAALRQDYLDSEMVKTGRLKKVDGTFHKYLKRLVDGLKDADPKVAQVKGKLLNSIQQQSDELIKGSKILNSTFTSFYHNVTKNVKAAEDKFNQSIATFSKALGTALVDTGKRIPGLVTNRIQHGFTENEYINAGRMGLSPQELNEFKSGMRDILNVMGGFTQAGFEGTTQDLRQWSDELKSIGLTGKEASEYLNQVARDVYRTGRTLDDATLNRMNSAASSIQQVFGGTIAEASKRFHDYNTQVFNLAKFSAAQTDEERQKLEEESKVRMKLAKYMGIEVEYLQQQQMLRHNTALSGLTDTIRGTVNRHVGLEMMRSQGLQISDADVELSKAAAAGMVLSPDQDRRLIEIEQEIAKFANASVARQGSAFAATGNAFSGIAAGAADKIAFERYATSGQTIQEIVATQTPAELLHRRNRQAGTFEQFDQYTDAQAAIPKASSVDKTIMEGMESIRGIMQSPIGLLTAAVWANVAALGVNTLALLGGGRGIGNMLRRGGGRGRGRGAAAGGAARAGTTAVGATGGGAAARTFGARLLGGAKGGVGGLVGGLALGYAADAAGRDTTLGASLDVGGAALSGAGTGALIGSVVPVIGTGVGAAVGGAIGAGYGLYKNRETLTENMSEETKKGALYGSMIMPGLGTVLGGTIGSLYSRFSPNTTTATPSARITPPNERNTVSFSDQTDTMNRIQRDASGNPITIEVGNNDEYLKKIAEINEKQLALAEDDMTQKRLREEQVDARTARQTSVKEHMDNLAASIAGQFTVPTA